MYLIIGYNDKDKEFIYLDEDRNSPERMKYEEAWGLTTGVYTILPRVNK